MWSIASAAGIAAASMGAGLLEANRTGGTVERVPCGWAERCAVAAADLARHGGALRSRQLPLPDCVGQVGHPLRRLRPDRLQRHAARVHALEQADSGAEQHG